MSEAEHYDREFTDEELGIESDAALEQAVAEHMRLVEQFGNRMYRLGARFAPLFENVVNDAGLAASVESARKLAGLSADSAKAGPE